MLRRWRNGLLPLLRRPARPRNFASSTNRSVCSTSKDASSIPVQRFFSAEAHVTTSPPHSGLFALEIPYNYPKFVPTEVSESGKKNYSQPVSHNRQVWHLTSGRISGLPMKLLTDSWSDLGTIGSLEEQSTIGCE